MTCVGRFESAPASCTESFILFTLFVDRRDPSLSLDRFLLRRRPSRGVDCSAQWRASSSHPRARLTSLGASLASLSMAPLLMHSLGGGIKAHAAFPGLSAKADTLYAATVLGRLDLRIRTFFFSILSSR